MANLFFDFDGTVADSEVGIVAGLKYMAQDRGLRPLDNSAYTQFIGPALIDMLGQNLMTLKLSGPLMLSIIITKRKAFIRLNCILIFWTRWQSSSNKTTNFTLPLLSQKQCCIAL